VVAAIVLRGRPRVIVPATRQMSLLDFSEALRAHNENFYDGVTYEISSRLHFLPVVSNPGNPPLGLCLLRRNGGNVSFTQIPQKLFQSSLSHFQKCNCWGPMLKTMSKDCAGKVDQAETCRRANHLVHWLLRRRLFISSSSSDCCIVPDVKSTPGPGSMKDSKEAILRNAGGGERSTSHIGPPYSTQPRRWKPGGHSFDPTWNCSYSQTYRSPSRKACAPSEFNYRRAQENSRYYTG